MQHSPKNSLHIWWLFFDKNKFGEKIFLCFVCHILRTFHPISFFRFNIYLTQLLKDLHFATCFSLFSPHDSLHQPPLSLPHYFNFSKVFEAIPSTWEKHYNNNNNNNNKTTKSHAPIYKFFNQIHIIISWRHYPFNLPWFSTSRTHTQKNLYSNAQLRSSIQFQKLMPPIHISY